MAAPVCRSTAGRVYLELVSFSRAARTRANGCCIINQRHAGSYTITTPIFYVNAAPHIGHLHTVLLADASCRWRQLNDIDVKLTTGTDEHGLKIQQAAAKAKESLNVYCTRVSSQFNDLFRAANIEYTDFVRTTDPRHKVAVEEFWSHISAHLYKGFYHGWYCVNDEAFLKDDQIQEVKDSMGRPLHISKESGQPCEMMEEENYMFPLSKFRRRLIDWHNTNVVYPVVFKASLFATLENLGDLSVSRSSKRMSWGIPVPGDPTQTIYVWLDALVNYLTVCGYPNNLKHWPVDCHMVGKDILKFHAIYWPAFLMAAELPLPKLIFCHSHWLVDDKKMSKSRGNVVDPNALMRKYTSDGLRYFLLREGVPSNDGNFSEVKMVDYLNSELCNTLGNLLNRCTSRSLNSTQIFPPLNKEVFDSMASQEWRELISSLAALPAEVAEHYENFNFYKGIDAIMSQLRSTNGFMEALKPWELQDQEDILKVVLHIIMENLRVCGILLQPIIPQLADSLLNRLGVPKHGRHVSHILPISGKKKTRHLEPGGPLYKRIDRANTAGAM